MKTLLVTIALIAAVESGEYTLPSIRHLTVFGFHAIDCKKGQTMTVVIKGDTADISCK